MLTGTIMTKFTYNHRIDKVDERDKKFNLYALQQYGGPLPPQVNLRDRFPLPILDQKDLGSCTACATSSALRYCLAKEDTIIFQPSRLFIYYFTRLLEGTVSVDSGAAVRDVMRAVAAFGACNESSWPYVPSKFTQRPTTLCINSAKRHISKFQYLRVDQTLKGIKTVLSSGYPIVCGISVYTSFEI